jgi:hypothetical protein
VNAYERAVIEAARRFQDAESDADLIGAVLRLEEHERAQGAAGITEVDWHTVAAGDQIQGKSGTFYPVLHVQAIKGGKVRLIVKTAQGERPIERPGESQPTAAVKRGPDGAAVRAFVKVFSSGG